MDYRQQMAQLASAPELARQRNLSMAQMLASLKGEGAGAGAVGTGVASSGLDPNILNRVAQLFPVDEEKANQLLNSHLLETSKINRTAALSKDFYSSDIQIAAPTPENPKATRFVSVADIQSMPIMPRLTAQGQATLAQKNAIGAAQPSAAQPSAAQPSAAQPSAAQPSNYLTTPAGQIASKIGKTAGDFTDEELDNLRHKESKSDLFAMNKQTKAMGAYQFTPETFIDLHKRGITFNPLDEKQAREVARNELNRLTKQLGSKELALSAYGGHKDTDPTNYINSIIKPSETKTAGTYVIKQIQPPSQTPLTPPSIGLTAAQKAEPKQTESDIAVKAAGEKVEEEEAAKLISSIQAEPKERAKTREAIRTIRDEAKTNPKAFGYEQQGGPLGVAAALPVAGPAISGVYAAAAGDAETRKNVESAADLLGVQNTKELFGGIGARIGAMLMGTGRSAKGVGVDFTAEDNLKRARFFELGLDKTDEQAKAWQKFQEDKKGNAFKFLQSEENKGIEKKYEDMLRKEFPSEYEKALKGPAAPAVGDVVKGHKFKGGNPSNRNNWEKI
jgi:hypothetical protein